jgi:glycosyltransferase involved in cell wall biosynthesis
MRTLCSELGLAEVASFAGFRADAPALLAGCDLLLAPAVNEGHGRTLIEAMMAGVPVVAAKSGGHSEIVQHERTGLLAPADDSEALANAALSLLAAPGRAKIMSQAARAWAVGKFSPAAHADAVADVYRRCLA